MLLLLTNHTAADTNEFRQIQATLHELEMDVEADYETNRHAYHERALHEDAVRTEIKKHMAGLAINVFQVRDAGQTVTVRTGSKEA